jgi:hypothetical protein|tara:strand:- start:218 stop:544 length:327 start_codon:yes stop_codon:yes gene_type:complete
MATFFHNITSILTKDLLSAGDNISNLKSITIANVDGSNDAKVDLFLNKGTDNFYILKESEIPRGFTLVLGPEDNIVFNNGTNGYSMRIQVDDGSGGACSVDVILKRGT